MIIIITLVHGKKKLTRYLKAKDISLPHKLFANQIFFEDLKHISEEMIVRSSLLPKENNDGGGKETPGTA